MTNGQPYLPKKAEGHTRRAITDPAARRVFMGSAPYTIETVVPPDRIPEETDPHTFNALISASKFLVRFGECVLIDGSNTRLLSGSLIVFSPEGERALAAVLSS